jgi:polyphosphate kinase 2 (PPK2 family)
MSKATRKKAKSKKHHHDVDAPQDPSAAPDEAEASPSGKTKQNGKMKRKEYERQMRILQGELVAMQEWVKATGARVCIVFEGVDSAGKGGTIRRITERASPRVFKHIALPAPDERTRSQMYVQRYMRTSRRPERS